MNDPDDEEMLYEECIVCSEREYDSAEDICYACGYMDDPDGREDENDA